MNRQGDTLVIGAGLAGLTAGWQAAQRGEKVKVIAKGWGATHWLSGCVDVLGYYPIDDKEPIENPQKTVAKLIAEQPQHPYARVGSERIGEALEAFRTLCADSGYPLHGSLDRNWLLPSAVGTFRPTCFAPETMIAGDLQNNAPMSIVGFKHLRDYYPELIADNLRKQGIDAQAFIVDLPTLAQRNFNYASILARMFEDTVFRSELVSKLKPHVEGAERVGFPAVLGLGKALEVKEALENRLRRPVFEIPSLTPSMPGIRLYNVLKAAIESHGGRVYDGMEALGAETEDGRVSAVFTETAARQRAHRYERYLLATGGILGGGIDTDFTGAIKEVVFNLPVDGPEKRLDWFQRDFLDSQGHPIYRSGLNVNENFQPVNGGSQAVLQNLYAAGTTLAHAEVIRERSFEGVAIATGYAAARSW